MTEQFNVNGHNGGKPEWVRTLRPFQRPVRKKALWQVFDTFSLYALVWWLMVLNLRLVQSLWIHLGLLMVAAGVYVRIFIFFHYRFPEKGDRRKQIKSLHITNAGIAVLFLVASWLVGWQTYLLIQLPIIVIAGAGGVWLFYIQHQFEGVYWARHREWDPMKAALKGSSFYQLPSVLQWFSGNIGFHHIHHVRPRIPNYHLEQCHDVMAPRQAITTLTLRDSLRSLKLKLWDEKHNRIVGFDAVKG